VTRLVGTHAELITSSIEVLAAEKGRHWTLVRTERVGSGNHSNVVGRARQATGPLSTVTIASQVGVVVNFVTCVREVRGQTLDQATGYSDRGITRCLPPPFNFSSQLI
jgi:hypothetical protein